MRNELFALAASYGLGCFSTGYYLVRIRLHRDIREIGSRSAGASNVGRTLGKTGFAVTFAGDLLKGILAIALANYCVGGLPFAGLAMFAVVAGHIFPVQLRGRGGKGIATAFGAVIACDYRLAVLILALFVLLYLLSRQWLRCGIIVILLAPLIARLIGLPLRFDLMLAGVAALLLFAHRDNIRRLSRSESAPIVPATSSVAAASVSEE